MKVGTSRIDLMKPDSRSEASPPVAPRLARYESIHDGRVLDRPVPLSQPSLDQPRCLEKLGETLDAGERRMRPLVQELAA